MFCLSSGAWPGTHRAVGISFLSLLSPQLGSGRRAGRMSRGTAPSFFFRQVRLLMNHQRASFELYRWLPCCARCDIYPGICDAARNNYFFFFFKFIKTKCCLIRWQTFNLLVRLMSILYTYFLLNSIFNELVHRLRDACMKHGSWLVRCIFPDQWDNILSNGTS